ncbi:MAG: RAMP superfamily CRISPR-associated protein [Synechococcales bacterium]|nr:RAMP superfamily CRISPR-associated protein [Synechococcales bacterium]
MQHQLDPNPDPSQEAGFVEYLRWMRPYDDGDSTRDGTKVQILHLAEENADYGDRLKVLTERTKRMAGKGNTFEVRCLWRIRVGGHRGPESILLPAFDALGMPYLPSSTLRGVARAEGIRDLMAKKSGDRKVARAEAEAEIAQYFGSLDAEERDRTGKVIFLDAYPMPSGDRPSGGLAVDMANNIWGWNGNSLDYSPNPNAFFSLEKSTFLIGLRPLNDQVSADVLRQVRKWLIRGLQAGVGSQVNTGYGALVQADQKPSRLEILRLPFTLEGQLIHGCQQFTQWKWDDRRGWQMRGKAEAEVRPVAFKSMLRYWFRVLTLGVLSPSEVQQWEATLFGAITPQATQGWLTVQVSDGKIVQPEAKSQQDPCGEQSGTLILAHSAASPAAQHSATKALFKNLAWLMFHLGGIGQGARRPCYSRKNRDRAPWWRGSTLIPETDDDFWALPEDEELPVFARRFRKRLQAFFEALAAVMQRQLNWQAPRSLGQVRSDRWTEAADADCRIVLCAGSTKSNKPYALAVLHDPEFKRQGDYDGNLCGQVRGKVAPSPVWIIDLGEFQVVTVFGATQDPRRQYLRALRDRTSRENFSQLWPI